jgi:predicted transcriptional regulator
MTSKHKADTVGAFMAWTKRVIRDPAAAKGAPRRWYDSEATARRAGRESRSAEAMVKLLSSDNLAVLAVIARRKPRSMRRLAELTGRKESNLSRTLKKLERAGIVEMRKGPGRVRIPALVARTVRLELDLTGRRNRLAIEG